MNTAFIELSKLSRVARNQHVLGAGKGVATPSLRGCGYAFYSEGIDIKHATSQRALSMYGEGVGEPLCNPVANHVLARTSRPVEYVLRVWDSPQGILQ